VDAIDGALAEVEAGGRTLAERPAAAPEVEASGGLSRRWRLAGARSSRWRPAGGA
jgi:hypothetical protein